MRSRENYFLKEKEVKLIQTSVKKEGKIGNGGRISTETLFGWDRVTCRHGIGNGHRPLNYDNRSIDGSD